MDGKCWAMDNIFIKRLWCSVKYEETYVNEFKSVEQPRKVLKKQFDFYNHERPHQSFNAQTPAEIYYGKNQLKMVGCLHCIKKKNCPIIDWCQLPNPRDFPLYEQKHIGERVEQKALPHVSVTSFCAQVASQHSLILRTGTDILPKSIEITSKQPLKNKKEEVKNGIWKLDKI